MVSLLWMACRDYDDYELGTFRGAYVCANGDYRCSRISRTLRCLGDSIKARPICFRIEVHDPRLDFKELTCCCVSLRIAIVGEKKKHYKSLILCASPVVPSKEVCMVPGVLRVSG